MNNFTVLSWALFLHHVVFSHFQFFLASRNAHSWAPDQFLFLFSHFLILQLKSQWAETLLFHSVASKHGFFFFLRLFFIFLCDVLDKLWKILQRRIEQSREGSLSAQHYCKYLGPQLSHSFTTVETCQATKNCKTNVIYQHFGDRFTPKKGNSAKTGLSPALCQWSKNFKCFAPNLR